MSSSSEIGWHSLNVSGDGSLLPSIAVPELSACAPTGEVIEGWRSGRIIGRFPVIVSDSGCGGPIRSAIIDVTGRIDELVFNGRKTVRHEDIVAEVEQTGSGFTVRVDGVDGVTSLAWLERRFGGEWIPVQGLLSGVYGYPDGSFPVDASGSLRMGVRIVTVFQNEIVEVFDAVGRAPQLSVSILTPSDGSTAFDGSPLVCIAKVTDENGSDVDLTPSWRVGLLRRDGAAIELNLPVGSYVVEATVPGAEPASAAFEVRPIGWHAEHSDTPIELASSGR